MNQKDYQGPSVSACNIIQIICEFKGVHRPNIDISGEQ